MQKNRGSNAPVSHDFFSKKTGLEMQKDVLLMPDTLAGVSGLQDEIQNLENHISIISLF
jgi:hypothetical protein